MIPEPLDEIIWIQDADNPTHGWKTTRRSLHKQGYGGGESNLNDCWIPKANYICLTTHPLHKTNPKKHQQFHQNQRAWVPKKKCVPRESTQNKTHATGFSQKNTLPNGQTSINYRWIPKITLEAQGYYSSQTTSGVPNLNKKLDHI